MLPTLSIIGAAVIVAVGLYYFIKIMKMVKSMEENDIHSSDDEQ